MYKSTIMLTIVALTVSFSLKAQSVPKLKFIQPALVSGINGQKGAMYQFKNVIPGVDAFVQIENIFGGAVLKNIDDSTLGYYDAWQPTVGGPDTLGSYSYIKWSIEFKTSAGAIYTFPIFKASSIDVDGDNVRVREFVEVNGQSGYDVPTQVPTLLQITTVPSVDNANGDDPNPTSVHALGPAANRTGIDTFSLDVRLNYQFTNKSKIKFYTGSQIDNNGNTGAIATDRYHCIYFHDVKNNLFSVLPVNSLNFEAKGKNKKVSLSWSVSAEISPDHFEIERSYDQKEFNKIVTVQLSQSLGSNSEKYNYEDVLAGNSNKLIYYKLKITDKKGIVFYSDVKPVRLAAMNNPVIKVSPNPFMDKLSVNYKAETDDKLDVRLINMKGNIIAYEQIAVRKGNNTVEMNDINTKPPGMYVVTVSANDQIISSQKVFKK